MKCALLMKDPLYVLVERDCASCQRAARATHTVSIWVSLTLYPTSPSAPHHGCARSRQNGCEKLVQKACSYKRMNHMLDSDACLDVVECLNPVYQQPACHYPNSRVVS
jgi:hypothetical protein